MEPAHGDHTQEIEKAWRRIFLLIAGFLLVIIGTSLWINYRPVDSSKSSNEWTMAAEEALKQDPLINGLQNLINALKLMDSALVLDNEQVLEGMDTREKIQGNITLLDEIFKRNERVVSEVKKAAIVERFQLPPTAGYGVEAPRPSIEQLRSLMLILDANAKRLIYEEKYDEAQQRYIELALLGARLTANRDHASLTTHLAGIEFVEYASRGILLSFTDRMPLDKRRRLASQMFLIEQGYTPVKEAVLAEADFFHLEMIDVIDGKKSFAEVIQYYDPDVSAREAAEMASALGSYLPTFEQENSRVWIVAEPLMDIQPPSSMMINRNWFEEQSSNRIVHLQMTDISKLLIRECIMIARWRIIQRILDTKGDVRKDLIDPFSGEPFIELTPTAFCSIGPDEVFSDGQPLQRDEEGNLTSGDICVLLPPWQE